MLDRPAFSPLLRPFLWTLLSAMAVGVPAASAATLWIEGEDAAEQQTFRSPWWEAVRTAELSGGGWLASFSEGDQPRGWGEFQFDVPEAGSYTLWMRVGTGDNHLAYQVDGGDKQEVDLKQFKQRDKDRRRDKAYRPAVVDERNLAADAKTDARYLAWVRLDEGVDLDAGGQTMKVWLGAPDADKAFAGVDAIVLTTEPFEPDGPFKPGETNPREESMTDAETWTFDPAEDGFQDKALVDLRSLNEAVAGEHGFIGLSDDNMSFVRGDGEPIRFWGGSDYNQRDLSLDQLKDHARFLAKRGVNIARWHGDLAISAGWPDSNKEAPTLATIDEKELDEAFKLVAAMKGEGIYTILSPYWGTHTRIRDDWKGQLPDPGSGTLGGLVFFVPEVQEAYKGFLRELYTRKNPYTGVPLKDEPAVAVIQLQNEDSLLFFTAGNIKGEAGELLRQRFADWLIEKHGSVEAVKSAWKGHGNDGWADGLPPLLHPWDYGVEAMQQKGGQAGFRERRADQLAFMTQLMRGFNAEMAAFLREELGAPQLINAGNWKSSDPVLADDAERYSYTASEVMGKNHYFSSLHTGRTRGYQVLPDNIYTNLSAAREPRQLPTNLRQPVGHPFIIPESLWVPPNKFEAEGPLVVASQQALGGVDAFFWFANGVPRWVPAVQGEVAPKWTYATPMTLGQFPAAALLFRRGLVDEAEPVVVEARPPSDIWAGTMPLTSESTAFDPNRDEGLQARESDVQTKVDPLAFLVGPVHVDYDASAGQKSQVAELNRYIDHDAGTIRSATGQIEIATEPGVYHVDAPRVQAAAGFLGEAGEVELTDVTITVENEFAAVTVVALDGEPIAESQRLLVQMGTVARPRGWTDERITLEMDGEQVPAYRIVDTGEQPWQVQRLRGRLSLNNGRVQKATVTDANFIPVRDLPLERQSGRLLVVLPEDALYLVLHR